MRKCLQGQSSISGSMESSSRDELRRRFRQQEVVAELGQQALETDDLDRVDTR